ncbi:MAG TPA: EamA family transporter [Caulobacteraceae bacterium]
MTTAAVSAEVPTRRPNALAIDLAALGVCAVIWGTTWHAITYQLGAVPAAWSVSYRFALASALLFAWLLVTRRRIALRPAEHLSAMGLGLFTFTLDYGFVYAAEARITSAVVAVVFASLALLNLVLFRIVLKRKPSPLAWGGALLGVAGVLGLFASELMRADMQPKAWVGLGFALAAVLTAGVGNLFAWRQQRDGTDVAPATAWAMGYGALALALWALATGQPPSFDPSPAYVLSLLYLSVFGSVIAFVVYYALARRRSYTFASYVAALTPPTAMLVSTLFEGVSWGPAALLGLLLVLGGQVLMIRAQRT